MPRSQANRTIAVGTPLGDDVLLLRTMTGHEQLGRMFQYELDLASEDPNIDVNKVLGDNMTVRLEMASGETRYFNGFVSRFSYAGAPAGLARYRATLVPWLWFLTRHANCRIFQEMTVPDIIKEVFRAHGFSDLDDQLSGSYRTWEYCVQYRETDFNFVSRLMEQEGIYYYFTHENGKHMLVLADSASAHQPYSGYEQIKFHAPGASAMDTEEHVSDWSVDFNVQTGTYTLNDFDFKDPKKALLAKGNVKKDHSAAESEIFDYPGEYVEYSDGEGYAKARIEELHSGFEVARGWANARGVACGYTFELQRHPREDQNRQYLITSAYYQLESDAFGSASGGGGGDTYSCSFTAINAEQSFRPARNTAKPSIRGPQTAVVVGKEGEEIWTDQFGRVKVKFHWDRYSEANEKSSCWIRVAQIWAGKKWGAMYIPRIGHEVIVEFIEGDPDHPIVTGRVYNGETMPPYKLPTNATKSTIKSNSSKGGQGFNEIRFEDKKGEEQIFIHAEKNKDTRVKNDRFEFVGNNRHMIVKTDQMEKVEANKHGSVGGDRFAAVGGDDHFKVEGDQMIQIVGSQHLKIDTDRMEKVGTDHNLDVGNDHNQKAGNNLSMEASTDVHAKAGSNMALEGGSDVHIKGGSNVVIEAGSQLSLFVGGNFVTIDSSGVSIKGTAVNINSGGSKGSGSGCSPTSPAEPSEPEAPTEPEEADDDEAGQVAEVQAQPDELASTELSQVQVAPAQPSPQAQALSQAAQDGTPFAEQCEQQAQEPGESDLDKPLEDPDDEGETWQDDPGAEGEDSEDGAAGP